MVMWTLIRRREEGWVIAKDLESGPPLKEGGVSLSPLATDRKLSHEFLAESANACGARRSADLQAPTGMAGPIRWERDYVSFAR